MPPRTETISFDGLAGLIDCALDWPEGEAPAARLTLVAGRAAYEATPYPL